MFETKRLVISSTIAVLLVAISAVVFFKGDVLLFAFTNSTQVRDEKADWDSYVKGYNAPEVAVELPKE